MPPMSRSLAFRLLLVFALLSVQLGGLAHGIEHTLAEQSHDQSLPHDKLCELCANYAQLGSALSSAPAHFSVSVQGFTFPPVLPPSFHPVTFGAFVARAPPRST